MTTINNQLLKRVGIALYNAAGEQRAVKALLEEFKAALLKAGIGSCDMTVEIEPVDMLLFCPRCGMQHIDAPEVSIAQGARAVIHDDAGVRAAWMNPPHRSHLCHTCGEVWRAADVPTNGVAALTTKGKADTWSLVDRGVPLIMTTQPDHVIDTCTTQLVTAERMEEALALFVKSIQPAHLVAPLMPVLSDLRLLVASAKQVPVYVDMASGPDMTAYREADTANEFYLQDSRSYTGNDIVWWATAGGYTTDVSKAEVFTLEKAQAQHDCRETDIPWPKAYIDQKTRPAVDMQYVDRKLALQDTGIVINEPEKRKREQLKCDSCGGFLNETQYYGNCPKCGAENRP